MTFHLYEDVWETSTTTGTGPYSLNGAQQSGGITFRTFSSQYSSGDTCWYSAYDGSNWEQGLGTYTSLGNTLTRTTVYRSTNSGSAVNWTSGTRQIVVAPLGVTLESLFTPGNSGIPYRSSDNTWIYPGTTGSGAVVLANSPTLAGTVVGPDGATWSSSGISELVSLGIGMTPTNVLDITKTQNSQSVVNILNANTSTSATAAFRAQNSGPSSTILVQTGTGYTPSGVDRADAGILYSNGAGGLTLTTGATQPIYFGINSSEVMRVDTSGRLLVGFTADQGGGQTFQVAGPSAAFLDGSVVINGTVTFEFSGSGTSQIYGTSAGLFVTGNGSVLEGDVYIQSASLTPGYAGVSIATGTQTARLGGAGITGSLSTSATTGFACIAGTAGQPTGSATSGGSGHIPIVIDTTNGKLWAHYGGAWHYTTFT